MFFQYNEPTLEHARDVLNDHEDSFELIRLKYENSKESLDFDDLGKLESISSDCIDILLASVVQEEVSLKTSIDDYKQSVFYQSSRLKRDVSMFAGRNLSLV
ncbi:MAG: hypothetical protein WC867_01235 [Candidatus Pacearchaeota archaeon]|jgi:hypothetical protein